MARTLTPDVPRIAARGDRRRSSSCWPRRPGSPILVIGVGGAHRLAVPGAVDPPPASTAVRGATVGRGRARVILARGLFGVLLLGCRSPVRAVRQPGARGRRSVLSVRCARLRRRPCRPAAAERRGRDAGLGRRGPVPRGLRRGPGRARVRCSRSPGSSGASLPRRSERRAGRHPRGRRHLPAVIPAGLGHAAVLGPAARLGGVRGRPPWHERRRRRDPARRPSSRRSPAARSTDRSRSPSPPWAWRPSWTGRVPPIAVVAGLALAGQVLALG